jgi:hypothetical protein
MIRSYIKRGILGGILLCAGMSLFAGEQQICRTSLSKAEVIAKKYKLGYWGRIEKTKKTSGKK